MRIEKLTREKINEAIPEGDVKAAFLQRPDIAPLSTEEQEARWAEHQVGLNRFLDFLATTNGVILP